MSSDPPRSAERAEPLRVINAALCSGASITLRTPPSCVEVPRSPLLSRSGLRAVGSDGDTAPDGKSARGGGPGFPRHRFSTSLGRHPGYARSCSGWHPSPW
ncbi:hypothetical protein AAFF_G00438750 [Aldrovandia affinis]|uniref:Uncharacterized protein n=1 Tax=Aldrovandia affinis TaxID=143900 RepID=A0AAD7R301_9TELE|nr:hypothetical protein AAFF_G00438750 [Aldrovandia affinis]